MLGRRMAGVCVIAVGMVCSVAGQRKILPPQCPPGATCRQVANPVEAVCSPVATGKDGLIHYTVFFNSKDTSQIEAFILAMDMWNCYSSVTGIRFDTGFHYEGILRIEESLTARTSATSSARLTEQYDRQPLQSLLAEIRATR